MVHGKSNSVVLAFLALKKKLNGDAQEGHMVDFLSQLSTHQLTYSWLSQNFHMMFHFSQMLIN